MVLGIIFCLSALMCVAVAVSCAVLFLEVVDYDFTSGAICFFFGCDGLSMLILGFLLFNQGGTWIAGYH